MPDASEEVISKLEQRIQAITSITSLLDRGMTPEDILNELLGDMGLEIMDKMPVQFQCNCSKQRVEAAIASIDPKDIQEMIQDNKPIEVSCHFCNKTYVFSPEELQEMLDKKMQNQ